MLGNKIDVPAAASEEEVRMGLGLNALTTGKGKAPEGIRPVELFMCRYDEGQVGDEVVVQQVFMSGGFWGEHYNGAFHWWADFVWNKFLRSALYWGVICRGFVWGPRVRECVLTEGVQ